MPRSAENTAGPQPGPEADAPLPSGTLLRAGRSLAGLSVQETARRAGLTAETVSRIEADLKSQRDPRRRSAVRALQRVIVDVGIEFLRETADAGAGVRFSRPGLEADLLKARRIAPKPPRSKSRTER